MARDVKYDLQGKLNGSVVWFSITTYPPEDGGGQTVRGPYFKKPAISKYLQAWTVLETYVLTQVDPSVAK